MWEDLFVDMLAVEIGVARTAGRCRDLVAHCGLTHPWQVLAWAVEAHKSVLAAQREVCWWKRYPTTLLNLASEQLVLRV